MTLLQDFEIVGNVLHDSEEVLIELESFDLWLTIVFNMFNSEELVIYGSAEIRIEKTEKLSSLKKKLQKFSLNLWSKMMARGDGTLYLMNAFDLKTREEDLIQKDHFSPQANEILNKTAAVSSNVG